MRLMTTSFWPSILAKFNSDLDRQERTTHWAGRELPQKPANSILCPCTQEYLPMSHSRLLAAFAVFLNGVSAFTADWQPAPSALMTKWGKQVTPENAWKEYPRPQLVRPEWQNLNGLWDYAITKKGAAKPETWDGKILVPFCA